MSEYYNKRLNPLTLDENGVLTLRSLHSQLVEGDDVSTILQDTCTGTLSHMQGTDLSENKGHFKEFNKNYKCISGISFLQNHGQR